MSHNYQNSKIMILSQLRKFDHYIKLLRFFLVISLLVVCTSCASFSSNRTYTARYPNSASLPAGNTPAFQENPSGGTTQTATSSRSTPVFTQPQKETQSTVPSVPKTEPIKGQGTRSTTIVPAQTPNAVTTAELDLIMGPRTVLARPGSEVILTAGLRDRSGYLRTNQRIDWSIAPQSVGHFSRIQKRELANIFVLDFVKPQIISDTQAVTTTSRSEMILDRGTPNLNDDIVVRRGESWISVSSPREGITTVTARAPKVSGNQVQSQTSRIVWVDAAVKLPESKLLDFGSTYTLTTALRRVSDAYPLEQWRVRYEICNNSSAVFGDGNRMLEVYTNRDGEAKIEMHQPIAREEETVVSVQIIRPAEGDFTDPVVVQDSRVHYRWMPNTINIAKSMPKEAYIGSIVPAVISVTNLTEQPLHNIRIIDKPPLGLALKGAVPEGLNAVDGYQWHVERLAPRETYTIQVNYRVEQPGSYISVSQVQAQKLGNNLVVECSATLKAGGEMSPYTPPMPEEKFGENEKREADAQPTPTFATEDPPKESEETESEREIERLMQENHETEALSPPSETGGGETSSKEASEQPSSNAEEAPKSEEPSKIYTKTPQRAPVFPPEAPGTQITIAMDADKYVQIGKPFTMKFAIENYTQLILNNVKIRITNTSGLSNQDPQNKYLIERNIRNMPAQKQVRLHMDFLPTQIGKQQIQVTLTLPNGKEFQREAHIFVVEADDKSVTPRTFETPAEAPTDTTSDDTLAVPETNLQEDENSLETPPEIESETPTTLESTPKTFADEEPAVSEEDSLESIPDSLELPGETETKPVENGGVSSDVPVKTPSTEGKQDTLSESSKESTNNENRAIRQSANPLPQTGPATVETVIKQENEHGDPAFTITLEESVDKIYVGDQFSYTLKLINTSSVPVKQIELMLAFPPDTLEIQKEEVAGPTEVDVNVGAGMVKYSPISEITPGQTVQYKVKVKAIQAGTIQAHAHLLENGTPRSQKTCETTIEKKVKEKEGIKNIKEKKKAT